MSDKDDKAPSIDMSLLDVLLRVKTLESLLINKEIFSREEYYQEMEKVARFVAKRILKDSNVEGNLDEIMDSFKKDIDTTKDS